MKTKLASILVLAAAFSAVFSSSLDAAPKTTRAHAVSVRTADRDGWEINRGTPAQLVLNRFGAPDTKLSANVWVYGRFHSVQNREPANQCGTLLVTVNDGVVTDLHLVNERALAIIADRIQADASIPIFVAKAR